MATPAPFVAPFYLSDAGLPLAAGLLYTYEAGTSTPKATYQDSAGLIPNTNPIVLDAAGRGSIFLAEGGYKLVLKTALGVTLWTRDNINNAGLVGSFQVVSTVADLKALSSGLANYVQVMGYYSAGDGGGGTFRWNSTSIVADDGGVTIQPNSAPATGRWVRVFSGAVDIRWYGAKGDGATADSTKIAAANSYLQALTKGGTLFFPSTALGYLYTSDPAFGSKVKVAMDAGAFFTSAGVAITFNGKFLDSLTQHFSATCGAVTFGKGAVKEIYPQWWGAAGDNSTESGAAIQSALDAGTATPGSTVRLLGGHYKVTGSITLRRDLSFIGDPEAYIAVTANNQKVFTTTTQTSRFKMSRIGIVNLGAFTGTVGIEGVGTRHNVVYEELYFEALSVGMRMKQLCWDTTARNCYAQSCGIGFEVTDSSHQFMFDRCTALNSTDSGFYCHAESGDIEPILFKTLFLQCLAQSSTNHGIKLKSCGAVSILGGYGEANGGSDIWAQDCLYLTTDNFYGGGDIGASHIKLRTCEAAQLNNVVCPGVRSVGTFDVDATNLYCEGYISRATSNNLISGTITGLHMQENINGSMRLGNIGHNSTKLYGVIDTIASAARHWHPISNNRNDKNDIASTNIIDCRSQYDVWRKAVRGGEFITFSNPEDGQHIFLVLRGTADMGDRPAQINVAGYNINMSGAAANQNTVIAMHYDGDYGWIIMADTGWNQYGNRTVDSEGLRLRSGSSVPSTGTWKKGDVQHNNAISTTNGLHGWKCTQSGTFSAYSQTAGSVNGSPLLVGITTTGLSPGDFVSMSAGFPALTIAQVLGLRTNSTATEGAGVSTNGSAVITGLADTSDFNVGDFVTASAGFPSTVIPYKITAKTASTVTLSLNATSSQTGITIQAVAGVELDSNANATVAAPGITVTTPDPLFERFGRALDKDFSVSYAQTGATNEISVENTGTGAADHAKLHAKTTGDGGGNPSVHLEVPGFGSISLGVDNSLANNPGVLAYAGILTSGQLMYLYPAANGGMQANARWQDKEGANVASAGDLTLGTGGNFFQLTGTTTINGIAIANWQSGAVVTLKFGGALTLTHNGAPSGGFGKLLMNGSVNAAATAGSVFTFRFDGTNWNEQSRMVR
jgi:hypothetical protein